MNRIILIGNGFDLAHGMKTSYKDFIDDYLENIKKSFKNIVGKFDDGNLSITQIPRSFSIIKIDDLFLTLANNKIPFEFKNELLKNLINKELKLWVDIEEEFYKLLKKIIDHKALRESGKFSLNIDLEKIEALLISYLKKIYSEFEKNINNPKIQSIINQIGKKIYEPLKFCDLSENGKLELVRAYYSYNNDFNNSNLLSSKVLPDHLTKLFQKINDSHLGVEETIRDILNSNDFTQYFELIPTKTLLLNFNYTPTAKLYKEIYKFKNVYDAKYLGSKETKLCQIHGSLNCEDKNPVIFGYGDELDENYRKIENLKDNNYLENMKSIKYLKTDNYKKLLEFINSDSYQIFVMGHSCGTSDRTLLNTLFEHDNCKSIKVFYHQESESKDNFQDIISNISRNFTNKAKMRDIVVNKTYCESMIDPKTLKQTKEV